MAAKVSLKRVVEELDALTDETSAYLNRVTGELYALGDEEAGLIEDGVDASELPEWLADEVPKIREVLDSADWLALPTRFDIHEWAIMDGFARSVADPGVRDQAADRLRAREPSAGSRTPSTDTEYSRIGTTTGPQRSVESPPTGLKAMASSMCQTLTRHLKIRRLTRHPADGGSARVMEGTGRR